MKRRKTTTGYRRQRMRDRRGAESAGASANSRSRRKRPYVSGATTVRFKAVYKFVPIQVALPGIPNHLSSYLNKCTYNLNPLFYKTNLLLYYLIVKGCTFVIH